MRVAARRMILLGCLLLSSAPALAIIIAVDMQPQEAGIQDKVTVTDPSELLTLDIVIAEAEVAIQGYEFDLEYDSLALSPTALVAGAFLRGAAGIFIAEQDLAGPDVNFALTALGLATQAGITGVLASVSFALLPGVKTQNLALELGDVILASATIPSQPLPIAQVLGGTAAVRATLPSTLGLLCIGLVGIGLSRRVGK